ncbi:hypothetical protein HPB47_012184 [Ixodes persulcatus]|uniref:Uncharacterized protein n=1 Tax=Ixodes persulcatus TaxID=34615 RepID=A0AC60NUB5_IXOPE|nr:hypothetical protein HPB47_012184 [Ixodes persulcatus]
MWSIADGSNVALHDASAAHAAQATASYRDPMSLDADENRDRLGHLHLYHACHGPDVRPISKRRVGYGFHLAILAEDLHQATLRNVWWNAVDGDVQDV